MNDNQKSRFMKIFIYFTVTYIFPSILFSADTGLPDSEVGEYYTVQPGDTLSDISSRFLNSPDRWPELWEMNSDTPVLNPHLIYPGQKLRIISKPKMPRMPTINTQTPDQSMQSGVSPAGSSDQSFSKGQDQPTANVPSPGSVKLDDVFERKAGKDYYFYSPINRIGFLRKEAITPSGKIFKLRGIQEMIGTDDIVYILENKDIPLVVGRTFTVYRTMKLMNQNGLIGIQHYMTGIVEIMERGPHYAVGKITKAFRPIDIGDLVMPLIKRSPNIAFEQSKEGIIGKVLAGEEGESIMGEDSIAFIDKGEEHGIKPGQQYNLSYQEMARPYPEADASFLPAVDFAKLLVLHTEPEFSTVLITISTRSVHPGTVFRSP